MSIYMNRDAIRTDDLRTVAYATRGFVQQEKVSDLVLMSDTICTSQIPTFASIALMVFFGHHAIDDDNTMEVRNLDRGMLIATDICMREHAKQSQAASCTGNMSAWRTILDGASRAQAAVTHPSRDWDIRRTDVCTRAARYVLSADALVRCGYTPASIASTIQKRHIANGVMVVPHTWTDDGHGIVLYVAVQTNHLLTLNMQTVMRTATRYQPTFDSPTMQQEAWRFSSRYYAQLEKYCMVMQPMLLPHEQVAYRNLCDANVHLTRGASVFTNHADTREEITTWLHGGVAIWPLMCLKYMDQIIHDKVMNTHVCGIHTVTGIQYTRSTTDPKEWLLQTTGSNFTSIVQFPTEHPPFLDTHRSVTTCVDQMQNTLGLAGVLQYLRGASDSGDVDPVQLEVLLSQGSRGGGIWDGMSRTTVESSLMGTLTRMSYETPMYSIAPICGIVVCLYMLLLRLRWLLLPIPPHHHRRAQWFTHLSAI
jgi:hypothetical protein